MQKPGENNMITKITKRFTLILRKKMQVKFDENAS